MKGYKGFDKDWKCKDVQFKVGETVTHNGNLELCNKGLHFCENPLDTLSYYPPSTSKYAEVEAEEVSDEKKEDSKRVAKKLTVKAELGIHSLIDAGVKFILEKVDFTKATENKEEKKGASNSGACGAASNSGDRGAASNSGDYGAASNSGYRGAASNSGACGAASNSGVEGLAISLGIGSKGKACLDTWITLDQWEQDSNGDWHRIDVQTKKVDGKKIKADTWYQLKKGKFVEVKD